MAFAVPLMHDFNVAHALIYGDMLKHWLSSASAHALEIAYIINEDIREIVRAGKASQVDAVLAINLIKAFAPLFWVEKAHHLFPWCAHTIPNAMISQLYSIFAARCSASALLKYISE